MATFTFCAVIPATLGGATGAYSLACDAGSFAVTGQATGLTASRTIALDVGSFALTGQDVALARGYSVTQRADRQTVLTSAADASPGMEIVTHLANGRLWSRVERTSLDGHT